MQNLKDLPFNVKLLAADEKRLSMTRPTTSTRIYSDADGTLDDDGIFSPLTFGAINSPERDKLFSYIPLNTTLIHPFIFKELMRLNSKYEVLLNKKKLFIWNKQEKDFILAGDEVDETEASNGYGFFMSHYLDIVFKENNSDLRQLRIDLLNKFRKESLMQNHLIIPAGLRDLEIDEDGREKEDEINPLYRKLIAQSKTISGVELEENNPIFDNNRMMMQKTMADIFDIFYLMVTGKKGFIQKKFARRRVFDGTRNVITSLDTSSEVMNSPIQVKAMDTQFGLFQTARGVLPLTINLLREKWLSKVITEDYEYARLVDPKTKKGVEIKLTSKAMDNWGSVEGLEKQILSFKYTSKRHTPIMIEKKWIGLIYQDNEKFKLFNDIDELPEHLNPDNVRAITWGELFYYSLAQKTDDIFAIVTRYPVTGEGSTYPTHAFIKTTTPSLVLKEMNENWEIDQYSKIYNQWPNVLDKSKWFDAMAPSPVRLALLGADFDGDMMSAIFVYSNEAVAECKRELSSKSALIDSSGEFFHGIVTDLTEWVLLNTTG